MNSSHNCLEAFCRNETVHRTAGSVQEPRTLGCGFIRKPGWHEDSQCPDHYSAVYLLRGRGEYADDQGETVALSPGCVFQRFPGRRHTLKIDPESDWAECYVALSSSFQEPLVALQIATPRRPVLCPGLHVKWVREFDTLLGDLRRTSDFSLARMLARIMELLSHLHEEDRRQALGSSHVGQMEMGCQLLSQDLASRATVEELIAPLTLGYENFRKLFYKHMGMSPAVYRIRCRIDAACTILTEERLSVKEVAARLGYSNAYALSAQFRQMTGLPPGRFRNGR
jgi:AraC-like DNA-binding protein